MKKTKQTKVIGYKAFDKDLKCRDMQYKVGKTYTTKQTLEICKEGFHFCIKSNDVFEYYNFVPETRVCLVEAIGSVITEGNKSVTNKIHIIKELTKNEVLELINIGKENTGRNNSGDQNSGDRNSGDRNSGHRNSGHWNSGHWNSGHRNSGDQNSGDQNSGHWNSGHWNSGHRNSGHWNSGDQNSGHWNSGHWNSGHRNSGLFNTNESTLRLFNKQTNIKYSDPRIQAILIYNITLTEFIWFDQMKPEEKTTNPKAEVTGGYLKTIPYKEAWLNFWTQATDDVRKKFLKLPNFNAKIFKEITGIDVKKEYK